MSTLEIVVMVVLAVLVCMLVWATIRPQNKPPKKTYITGLPAKRYVSSLHNGKCNKSRCRRQSRQHPINGAWRQK